MTSYLLFLIEVCASMITILVVIWCMIAIWITGDLVLEKLKK